MTPAAAAALLNIPLCESPFLDVLINNVGGDDRRDTLLRQFAKDDFAVPPESLHERYEAFVPPYLAAYGLRKHVLSVRRGQAVLWAGNLYHGGEFVQNPNRTRHSVVVHFYFPDCLYYLPRRSRLYEGQLHLRPVVNIRDGQTVPHRFRGRAFRVDAEHEFWMRPTLGQFLRTVVSRVLVADRRRFHR